MRFIYEHTTDGEHTWFVTRWWHSKSPRNRELEKLIRKFSEIEDIPTHLRKLKSRIRKL